MNNYSTYTDEQLLPLLKEPKPASDNAFYVLYQRYATNLNAYCLFKVNKREAAEEIFQETWLKFDKAVKDNKVINNVQAYLITIARNLCSDYIKYYCTYEKNLVRLENISLDNLGNPFNYQKNLEKDEMLSLIKVAVNNLDDIYKEAFILKKFEGMHYDEIAEICGESVDCIKTRVRRAILMLKDFLKPYINEFSK